MKNTRRTVAVEHAQRCSLILHSNRETAAIVIAINEHETQLSIDYELVKRDLCCLIFDSANPLSKREIQAIFDEYSHSTHTRTSFDKLISELRKYIYIFCTKLLMNQNLFVISTARLEFLRLIHVSVSVLVCLVT